MTIFKSIPRKCPKCGCLDIGVHSYHPFTLGCVSEVDVNCSKCGIFGTVKVRVIPLRGTFEPD